MRIRHYFVPINGIQWLTLLLLAALVGGFAYGFGSQHATSASLARTQKQIAHVQDHQGDALRSVLCFAEHTIRIRPGIPHKQRVDALQFYRRALKHAHLRPCKGD